MIVKLLTEHHLEFLSLKGGCLGSSESTHVKMPQIVLEISYTGSLLFFNVFTKVEQKQNKTPLATVVDTLKVYSLLRKMIRALRYR